MVYAALTYQCGMAVLDVIAGLFFAIGFNVHQTPWQ